MQGVIGEVAEIACGSAEDAGTQRALQTILSQTTQYLQHEADGMSIAAQECYFPPSVCQLGARAQWFQALLAGTRTCRASCIYMINLGLGWGPSSDKACAQQCISSSMRCSLLCSLVLTPACLSQQPHCSP